MDPQFEGLTEAELKQLLDKADDYDERSKIRSAIRVLKRSSGKDNRRTTGTSVYRRPGFQAPRTVQIPNSVTGNVMPSSLKDGESIKPPDKNTPTIGYLDATTTVKSPKRSAKKPTSQSGIVPQNDGSKEDSWWTKSQSSSRSMTPSDTSEQRIQRTSVSDSTSDQVFNATPEPPKEATPEPPREPTPEPVKEPTPEPIKEPTPEPAKEPTPEPVREPTPEPAHEQTPSPEPVVENVPSPEPEESGLHNAEEEDEEKFSDDEDEELRALEEEGVQQQSADSQTQLPNKSIPIDVLQEVEPGLEENKDFRTKLRKAEDTKIDTTAAFPSQKKTAEQIDFRNVLRKTTGPEKKSFKVEQVDFREKLKPKDTDTKSNASSEDISTRNEEETETHVEHEEQQPVDQEEDNNEHMDVPEEKSVKDVVDVPEEKSVKDVVEEDSYEARKEARRKEKEEREKQMKDVEKTATESVQNGIIDEDSYEARREARRKAREARRLKEQQESKEKPLSYRERQQLEQAKRMEENKKKWGEMDQLNSNGNVEKPAITRQKSSGAQKGAQQLLAWCQHKTRYYENVEVKDFSNSFANGLALCAILHSFVPDDIPYDDLSPDNPAENFGVALQVAEDVGIGSFFDVEDLVSVKAPDPKSMMTFLATIYQHFK